MKWTTTETILVRAAAKMALRGVSQHKLLLHLKYGPYGLKMQGPLHYRSWESLRSKLQAVKGKLNAAPKAP